MSFRIIITMEELRIAASAAENFVQAYASTDLGDLEIHLEFSQINMNFMLAQFECLPSKFESEQNFMRLI